MSETKKIAVTTDTNSGLMPRQYDDKGLFVLPMPFVIEGESMLESVTLSRENFYVSLKADKNISTSQPSVTEVTDFWSEILKEYDQIVHIPTSSLLSNACSTAQTLAKDFEDKVFVVDNLRISEPLKQSAFDAVKLRDSGKTAEEIKAYLESTAGDYELFVSLDSMKYLKKGGRISPAVATIGSMLKLRPVLKLANGKLEKFAIPRTMQKASELIKTAIATDLKEKYKEYVEKGEMRICLVYGEDAKDTDALKTELEKLFPSVPVLDNAPMSLSIACHVGPNVIALGLIRVVND